MKGRFFTLLLILLLFIPACKQTPQRLSQPDLLPNGNSDGRARISLYLEAIGNVTEEISIRLVKIEISDGRLWFEIPITKLRLNRHEIVGQQLFLATASLEPATYHTLRLTFAKAQSNGNPQLGEGEQRQVELPITHPLALKADSSTCLFIDWLNRSETISEDLFTAFVARFQTVTLGRDLITVLCRDINTLYQITPDQNRVVSAFGLSGPLGETAFDPLRRRFYVVGSGIKGLYVIDAASNRLIDTFALPLTETPAALALSADRSYAFVTDTMSDRILKIDLNSGFVVKESLNNLRPNRMVSFGDPDKELLAVISASERQVSIINPVTLKRLLTINVNGVPAAAAVLGDYIYVADRNSDNVLVYNLSNGNFEYYLKVGREPIEMAVLDHRIYVASYRENYLSILVPRQKTTLRRISCDLGPVDLAISKNWRKLYVANRKNRLLSVFDLHSGTNLSQVQIGGQPSEITIWER